VLRRQTANRLQLSNLRVPGAPSATITASIVTAACTAALAAAISTPTVAATF
jgi:hypothetical protein